MTQVHEELGILALLREYNRAIDAGEGEAWAATFVPEGIFHHPARDWVGAEELRKFCVLRAAGFEKAPLVDMRHWNDAVAIRISGDEATVTCDLAVIGNCRETGKPKLAARGAYTDRLVRRDGAWRFASRKLVLR